MYSQLKPCVSLDCTQPSHATVPSACRDCRGVTGGAFWSGPYARPLTGALASPYHQPYDPADCQPHDAPIQRPHHAPHSGTIVISIIIVIIITTITVTHKPVGDRC
jgi:hypothetical protein